MLPAFEKHLENNQFVARWEKAETVDERCAICEEFLKKKGKWPAAVEPLYANKAMIKDKYDVLQAYYDKVNTTNLPPLPPAPNCTDTYTTTATITQNKIEYLSASIEIPEPPFPGDIMPTVELVTKDLANHLALEMIKGGYVQITQEQNHMNWSRLIKAKVRVLKP